MSRPAPWSLARGLCNVEGPTVGPDGWILNVNSLSRPEQPDWPTRGGDITATHPRRPHDTRILLTTSTDQVDGIPAALAFGPDGALYICDEGRRSIVRVDPDGTITDFISEWRGERLNGPNDLSFDQAGNLYFTDPWQSSPRNPVAAVYGYDWNSGELTRIDAGLQFTNGIIARDGRLLVAETYPRQVWAYDLTGGGRAGRRQEFCTLPDVPDAPRLEASVRAALGVDHVCGPDGMACDADGRVYVAHYGSGAVYVYDPGGREADRIAVPGVNPTNVCFGGDRHDQLFVAVDDIGEIVVFDLGITGDRISWCPSGLGQHPWRPRLPARPGRTAAAGQKPPGGGAL